MKYFIFTLMIAFLNTASAEVEFNTEPDIGHFADAIGQVFFSALRGILLDSIYGRDGRAHV